MKFLALLVLSVASIGCDDSIRSRSTITQNSSSGTLKASLSPQEGTVANIYKTSDYQTFNPQNEDIEIVKSKLSSFIKSTILKVEGNLIYKFVETRNGTNPVERKVSLEFIDLNSELNDLVRKNNAEVSGESIRIEMKLRPTSLTEPQIFYNQMISYDSNSEYEALYSLKNPFCEFRSVLTITTNLYVDGDFNDSAVSEIWERASCGNVLTQEEIRAIDLRAISFCDQTAKAKQCEIKNLEHLKL